MDIIKQVLLYRGELEALAQRHERFFSDNAWCATVAGLPLVNATDCGLRD